MPLDPQPGLSMDPSDPGVGVGLWGHCVSADGTSGPLELRVDPIQYAGPTMTPEQAAWEITRSIQFAAIEIGMAPEVFPEWGHRRTYVGLPVWMWAADRTSLNYGPHSVTESVGGLVMSLTATVDRVEWDMGDGTVVSCGPGHVYVASYGMVPSPSCGHEYSRTSRSQPGGMYTVTATSYWVVTWSSGGQSGTLRFEMSATTQVEVLELQAVNVPGPPGP